MSTIIVRKGSTRSSRSRNKTLGAVVPSTVYELAYEQARIDRTTVSAMLSRLIVKYLRARRTVLTA